ncbi:MAG: hypothetical protein WA102_11585 [Candidatus Methanoperedens sp.]
MARNKKLLFEKNKTIERTVGPYLLVSIPYGDVVLLKEELYQIWNFLPPDRFTIDKLFDCMKQNGIDTDKNPAKFVLEKFLQMGMINKK